jgi:hypothetical protein
MRQTIIYLNNEFLEFYFFTKNTVLHCVNFCFFSTYTFFCRVLGMHAVLRRGSPCLRMWRGRRPTMQTTKGSRHGGKGGDFGVPFGRL